MISFLCIYGSWTAYPAELLDLVDVVLENLGLGSLVEPIELRDVVDLDIIRHTFHDTDIVIRPARCGTYLKHTHFLNPEGLYPLYSPRWSASRL